MKEVFGGFSAAQIDLFARQQPALEIHLKNLSQGFSKYLERHSEVYEHDIQRVGDLFIKLNLVVQTDLTTTGKTLSSQSLNHPPFSTGIEDLSNSMSKISHSYNDIAELYKTKVKNILHEDQRERERFVGS